MAFLFTVRDQHHGCKKLTLFPFIPAYRVEDPVFPAQLRICSKCRIQGRNSRGNPYLSVQFLAQSENNRAPEQK